MTTNPEYTFKILLPEEVASLDLAYLSRAFQKILNIVRDIAPIRTGNLRRSIHLNPYAFENGYAEIFIDTEYFLNKAPYYIYTNERADVWCHGWWEKLCGAYARLTASLVPRLSQKASQTFRLTERDLDLYNIATLAAIVSTATGELLQFKPYPTQKELNANIKTLTALRAENRGAIVRGLTLTLLTQKLIEKLSEGKTARKEITKR